MPESGLDWLMQSGLARKQQGWQPGRVRVVGLELGQPARQVVDGREVDVEGERRGPLPPVGV